MSGRAVHVAVPHALRESKTFLSQLERKFFDAQAESIHFYFAEREIIKPFYEALLTKNQGLEVTKPGEKIPGSDVVRKAILSPLIESGQLVWLYGPAKSGKSRLARCMAHVISYGGTFLGKYQAASDLKVLFVDGEMAPDKLEEAFDVELAGLGLPPGVNFSVEAAKRKDNPYGEINLLSQKWKDSFDSILHDYDVIFFDCYYSLINKVMPAALLKWLTPWKNKGKTFIIVDHTNKKGKLQGGSDKERAADLCIEITPKDNRCVEISFPMTRYLGPEDSEPFTLISVFKNKAFRFELLESEEDSTSSFSTIELRSALAYACKKSNQMSVKEFAECMKYSKSSVYAWIKKIKKDLKSNYPSRAFDIMQRQIERYEKFTKEELTKEAHRLVRL